LKKILICEIIFFQISAVYYLFFIFFVTFYFQFRLSVLVKKFHNFLCFFILCIRDFIKQFWGIMEYFSRKYRHLKSKILRKFHYFLFVFNLLAFLMSLFPISPNQSCQKIQNSFVVLYYMDYSFYQRILENSWLRKIEIL